MGQDVQGLAALVSMPEGKGAGRPRRDLPRAIADAGRLIASAGRAELVTVVVLELLTAACLSGLLLFGSSVVSAVLEADRQGDRLAGVLPQLVGLVVVSALLSVAQALVARQYHLLGELTSRQGQGRILDVTCAVDLAAFDQPGFHDRVARAASAVDRSGQIVNGLLGLLQAVAGLVGALVALTVLQPLLLPPALLALVPGAVLSSRRADAYYRFAAKLTPRDRERRYLMDVLADRDAAKEVRAMGLAGHLRERYDRRYAERIDELRVVVRRQLRWSVLAGVATTALVGSMLVALLALALDDQIPLATAATATGAVLLLNQRLIAGSMSVEMLLESAMFVQDYFAFLELEPAGTPVATTASPHRRAPEPVVAEDVWFSYPDTPAPTLRGVSLRVEPGEIVALVGANGSGKSTLAKLLTGLYRPDRGRVILQGRETDGSTADGDVGVVFQDFLRYALPAYDNIALGRHERIDDAEAVRSAARRAGIDRKLESLPIGFRTQLGPAFAGGVDLSLGQWQKMALARMFFRDAPFVVLDEPTASLDAQAEHELFDRIGELFDGRSVLIISHRFSTVRAADRILVLHEGQLVEEGDHAELLALGGRYAKMFDLQAAGYAV
jgi:ATP-binding cassette subfamily B protein